MSAQNLTTYLRTDTVATVTTSEAEVHVVTLIGTTWTDQTIEANSAAHTTDVLLASAAEADPEGDAVYYGCMGQYSFLSILMAIDGVFHNAAHAAQTAGEVWEYWNGAATDLAETDATVGYTHGAGSAHTVTWTCPTDWIPCSLRDFSGDPTAPDLIMYWIRSIYTGVGHHVDTVPALAQVQRGGALFLQPNRVRHAGATSATSPIVQTPKVTDVSFDINDYFELNTDSLDGQTNSTGLVLWAISDTVGLVSAATNSFGLMIYEASAYDHDVFNLFQYQGGVGHFLDATWHSPLIFLYRRYYIHIFYDASENHLHAYIHSERANWTDDDAAGVVHLDYPLPHATVDGTYFTAMCAAGGIGNVSCVTSNYHLGETPSSILTETNVSLPMNWTQEQDTADLAGDWNKVGDLVHIEQGAGAWADWIHITAVEAENHDAGAYIVPSSAVFGYNVVRCTFNYVDGSLDASHYRRLLFVYDASHIAYASIYNSAGTLYWRIETPDEVSWQNTYTVTPGQDYVVTLGLGWGVTTAGVPILAAYLYVDNTLVDVAQVDATYATHIHATRVGLGSHIGADAGVTTLGGEVYCKDFKYKDGATYFPSIGRGGASDATLVYTQRVADNHIQDYKAYLEIFSSTDDAINPDDYKAVLGPTVNYDYRKAFPIWDGTCWWFFVQFWHNEATDDIHTNVYKTKAEHPSDFTDLEGPLAPGVSGFSFDHVWVFPSRMIETWGGKTVILCGIETEDTEGAGYPSEATQFCEFGHFELGDDYTLTHVAIIAHYGHDIPLVGAYEPFPFRRPGDGTLGCLMRRELVAGDRDNFLHIDTSAGGDGTTWSTTIWPGEDWSDISACLRAFVFRGYLWVMGRDSQIAAGPWQQVLWKCDPETLALVSERTWPMGISSHVWEVGNGDEDAKDGQIGEFQLDVTFDLGLATFRRIGTGLLASARRQILLSNF
jgi:hypothetical protein